MYKSSLVYFSILSATLLFFSCEEETSAPFVLDELTVSAFLFAGEPVDSVYIGRIIPFDSSLALSPPEGLEPVLISESGTNIPLFPTGETGVYANLDHIIETEAEYEFELSYNEVLIQSSTYVPTVPANASLSTTQIRRDKIDDFFDLQNQVIPDPVEVNWEGPEGSFFFVKMENIETEPEIINELFGDSEGGPPSGFGSFQTEPSESTTYALNSFRDITHFGTHEITIYHVNPEYVLLYEDSNSGNGNLNEIINNIENGWGIFTGINATQLYLEVVRN